jgi:DNA-binding transcriptional LysR family regulator
MALGSDWERQLSRRVKLRELDVFIAVAQRGSMARAAADLGITQPAVSEMMGNLEQALAVRLLDRSSRGVTPTIYGQVLLRGGRAAMDDLRQSIQEMRFLADPTAGDVRVGCPETVAMLLPPIVKRLSKTHPRVLVHVSDVVAPTLDVPQLRDRSLDLALVRFGGSPQQHPFADDLKVEILFNDELVIVAGKSSRWARDRKINLEKLVDAQWILPPLTTSNSRTVFEAFHDRGLPSPKVSIATFSLHLRTSMLGDGTHVSVLPRSLLQVGGDHFSLRALPIKLPRHDFPLAIVTLKNRMLNPVVQLFTNYARDGLRAVASAHRARRPRA